MELNADFIQVKPPHSIGTNRTLTWQSLQDDTIQKSRDKHTNGNSKHILTTRECNGIGNNITTKQSTQESNCVGNITITLARLARNNTREHHNKVASGEYIIPEPTNKPGGYGNHGVSTTIILVAAISKRLGTDKSSSAKEKHKQR